MHQKRIFFILLAVLILSTLYAFRLIPGPGILDEPATNGFSAQQPSGSERLESLEDRQRLRIDLLKPSNREYPGFTRDIFGPLFVPPKVERNLSSPSGPQETVIKEIQEVSPLPGEDAGDALELFTFLGFLDKEGKRTVFLTRGEVIFIVNEKEHFGENGRFTVVDITEEKLSIRQNDPQRLITIALVEKGQLVPSFETSP